MSDGMNASPSQVLTSEEIAALASETNVVASEAGLEIKPIDFNDHTKSHNQFSNLAVLNEEFCLKASEKISKFLRYKISIVALTPQIVTYADFVTNAKLPISLNLLSLTEQKSSIILSLSGEFLYAIINLLFGGSFYNDDNQIKQFGKTDERIASHLIKIIMESLQVAWKEVGKFSYEIIKTMLHPVANNLLAPQGELIICGYVLKLNELELPFHLCFEKQIFNTLNFEMKFGSQRLLQEGQAWLTQLRESVFDAAVTLTASFPKVKVSLKELTKLKIGDVIMLDDPKLVYITIQGVSFFSAHAAMANGTRVINVIERIKY